MAIEETHRSYDDIVQELEPEERSRVTLRDLCGLFVVIIDAKIYLLHQTAKEFLVRDHSSASLEDPSRLNSQYSPLRWKHSLQRVESNRILAERCIWYLTSDFFETRLSVLLDYSARNWPTHFREAGIRSEEAIAALARSLCETGSKRYNAWSAIYASSVNWFPKSASSLAMASYFGLDAVVKLLVEREDVEADSKDSEYGQTPLSWAAERGHETVVQLLVDRDDVEADSKSKDGRTPLSWAAENGYEAVVQLLVDQDDVEADSKDKGGQTPLSWAARRGHEAVVKLLVDRDDVEADSKDKGGQTPLSRAATNGHEAVVKLLVDRDDVEADSKGKDGQTPLSWAARYGHEVVVKLLVDRDDVEADSKDSEYGQTPLSWAARRGHEVVVKLLVDRDDVEADSKDKDGRTPLSWAARRGHEAVVKLLQSPKRLSTA